MSNGAGWPPLAAAPIAKKAIIPAAGLGTRMSSISKGRPKELLMVGSKPIIQWSLEMHLLSGFEELAIILHPEKEQIREYIEEGATRGPEGAIIKSPSYFREMLKNASIRFFYQQKRDGVVAAVTLAKNFINNKWFALVMPDCLLFSEEPFLNQTLRHAPPDAHGVIGFLMLEKDRAQEFGNVGLLSVSLEKSPLYRIDELSDKGQGAVSFQEPVRAKGFGGGVYSPTYFDYAARMTASGAGELDDVPIHQSMAHSGKLFGIKLEGAAFDVGNPQGYFAAQRFVASGPFYDNLSIQKHSKANSDQIQKTENKIKNP